MQHSDVMVKALTMQIKRFISAHELSAGKDESGTGAALVLHQVSFPRELATTASLMPIGHMRRASV